MRKASDEFRVAVIDKRQSMQSVDSYLKQSSSFFNSKALCTRYEMGNSSQMIDHNQHTVKAIAHRQVR
jgi:hypothetical protein